MMSDPAPDRAAASGARDYEGDELDLFSDAIRWKAYWSSLIAPYLGSRVLDVGAGLGATARIFGDRSFASWLALEPDPRLGERMRDAVRSGELPAYVQTRCGGMRALQPDEIFDTILYIDVLEHIEDDRGELERAAGHLAPNGYLVVLSPAHDWLYTPFDRAIGHFRRYSRHSLQRVLPAQLRLERMSYLDCAGMLASLGNRLLLRQAHPTPQQIRFWDRVLVPISRVVDSWFAHRVGKTIVAVLRKRDDRH